MTIRRITNIIRHRTTLPWTCQGEGGCGTTNPNDASRCTGCSRPW